MRGRTLLNAFTLIHCWFDPSLGRDPNHSPCSGRSHRRTEGRFRSDVDLASLQVSIFPPPEIHRSGLTLRHSSRTDVALLIKIESYSASAGLWGLTSSPLHLKTVELDRLGSALCPEMFIPITTDQQELPDVDRARRGSSAPAPSHLIIDQICSRTATLQIVTCEQNKLPRVFEIHNLVMHGLGDRGGATFEAALSNPKPCGGIDARNVWSLGYGRTEPEPLREEYVFKAANEHDQGHGRHTVIGRRVLRRARTHRGPWRHDKPDLSIDIAAQPVPPMTRFHAIVDGTNGDTWLERIEARIIETLIVTLAVRTRDVKGRRISLDVASTFYSIFPEVGFPTAC